VPNKGWIYDMPNYPSFLISKGRFEKLISVLKICWSQRRLELSKYEEARSFFATAELSAIHGFQNYFIEAFCGAS